MCARTCTFCVCVRACACVCVDGLCAFIECVCERERARVQTMRLVCC
ncbi:MAG: hypothetical protein ACK55Z_10210 [bacterium]